MRTELTQLCNYFAEMCKLLLYWLLEFWEDCWLSLSESQYLQVLSTTLVIIESRSVLAQFMYLIVPAHLECLVQGSIF